MTRGSALVLILCFAGALALPSTLQIGTCKHQVSLNVTDQAATLNVVLPASAPTTCKAENITFVSFFPKDVLVTDKLVQRNGSSVIMTTKNVASKIELSGYTCLNIENVGTQFGHMCKFTVQGTVFYAYLITSAVDGGSFNTTAGSSFLITDIAAASNVTLSVVTQCGNASSHIVDQNQSVSVTSASTNDVNAIKALKLEGIVVRVKYTTEYKAIDIDSALNLKPFATAIAVAVAANASVNASGVNASTNVSTNTQCFHLGSLIYQQLVHNPDVSCWFGCDLIIGVADASGNVAWVQTGGFDTDELILSKAAIGLIVGLIVGILVLCSCICGIIYLCRRRSQEPDRQRLVNK